MTTSEYNKVNGAVDAVKGTIEQYRRALMKTYLEAEDENGKISQENFDLYQAAYDWVNTNILANATFEGSDDAVKRAKTNWEKKILPLYLPDKKINDKIENKDNITLDDIVGLTSEVAAPLAQTLQYEAIENTIDSMSEADVQGVRVGLLNRLNSYDLEMTERDVQEIPGMISAFGVIRMMENQAEQRKAQEEAMKEKEAQQKAQLVNAIRGQGARQ
ncbi:MAG: hypothetical protein ABIF40_02005 [archaeon]